MARSFLPPIRDDVPAAPTAAGAYGHYWCDTPDGCGQMWRIERSTPVTVTTPTRCPGCGALVTAMHVQPDVLDARCFAPWSLATRGMAWLEWCGDTPTAAVMRRTYGTFVAFLRDRAAHVLGDVPPELVTLLREEWRDLPASERERRGNSFLAYLDASLAD